MILQLGIGGSKRLKCLITSRSSLYNLNLTLKNGSVCRTYTKDTVTSGKLVPQLDFKNILKNSEKIIENVKNRNVVVNVPNVVSLINSFNALKQQTDANRRERNEIAEKLKNKSLLPADRDALIQAGKAKRDAGLSIEEEAARVHDVLIKEALRIPNDTHPDVPIGMEDKARVMKTFGVKPNFSFKPKNHIELGELHDMIDFEAGAKVTGHKFFYLKNDGVLLELALVNWSIRKLLERGWTPIITPDVARHTILEGIGFQPRSERSQIYSLAGHDAALVGTAEVTLGGMYADQLLPAAQLPIKLVGLSHCFRAEVGEAGKEVRGLYRVHQFTKVEMFALCVPEHSERLHQEMLDIEVELLSALGLHCRVLDMPTAELGAPAYRKFDIEAYMPFKNDYGEVTSASNCTDYQSRRLNIRCQFARGQNTPLHTLNGTACAVPRWMLAIMECNQQEDGSIVIPPPLVPYMGKDRIVPRKKATK